MIFLFSRNVHICILYIYIYLRQQKNFFFSQLLSAPLSTVERWLFWAIGFTIVVLAFPNVELQYMLSFPMLSYSKCCLSRRWATVHVAFPNVELQYMLPLPMLSNSTCCLSQWWATVHVAFPIVELQYMLPFPTLSYSTCFLSQCWIIACLLHCRILTFSSMTQHSAPKPVSFSFIY